MTYNRGGVTGTFSGVTTFVPLEHSTRDALLAYKEDGQAVLGAEKQTFQATKLLLWDFGGEQVGEWRGRLCDTVARVAPGHSSTRPSHECVATRADGLHSSATLRRVRAGGRLLRRVARPLAGGGRRGCTLLPPHRPGRRRLRPLRVLASVPRGHLSRHALPGDARPVQDAVAHQRSEEGRCDSQHVRAARVRRVRARSGAARSAAGRAGTIDHLKVFQSNCKSHSGVLHNLTENLMSYLQVRYMYAQAYIISISSQNLTANNALCKPENAIYFMLYSLSLEC